MKIIVDAMGGDFAPLAPVKGALMAQEKYGVDIVLTGKTEEILKALQQCSCKELPKGMEIANATEVVEICDDPATAFKHKKDSSLTVGLNMLHAGDADGFVPYDMGKRNYEACRAKGKKFLTVHGAEHAVSYYHDNDAYTKQATEFLQDCLARRGFVWPPETDEPEK